MHVGFVGTGNMGRPMARNILKAGHALTVFDLEPAATAPLEALGAHRAADLASLARAVRVTLMSLPDARAVEAALFGAAGLMDGARSGDVVFDLSTVGPASTVAAHARMAERGVQLIDAPVSGSVSGAEAGTLAVMIGATAEAMAPYEPILRAIGKNFFWLGAVGRGNILKLLNNYIAVCSQAVLCEAFALADRLDIPRETVGEVVSRSSGASFVLERKLPNIVKHDYRAGFFMDLAWKDVGLALELSEAAGAQAAVGREAWKLYARARDAGLGRLDSLGVLGFLEPGFRATGEA